MNAPIFAYAKEHYLNGKYIGSIILQEPDRAKTGYEGKMTEVATSKIQVEKKTIKPGQTYHTVLIPLSGRLQQ